MREKNYKRLALFIALPTVLIAVGIYTFHYALPALAASTYTVNSIGDGADANPGDNVCETSTPGVCTLRAAIQEANANAGADTINFRIAGSGLHTIQPTSAYDAITDQVTINGYSQTGAIANTAVSPNPFNGTLTIEIDGQNAGNVSGLEFTTGSEGSIVKGLVINRFANSTRDGVRISTDNITVQGSYIGTNNIASIARGNDGGIQQGTDDSDNAQIGGTNPEDRNIISGNISCGSSPNTNSDNWVYEGNYIGMAADGITALGNGSSSGCGGLSIDNNSGTRIGGTSPGATNLLSGNGGSAIQPDNTTGLIIQGNLIGTDYTGMNGIGNSGGSGIAFAQNNSNALVGGTTSAARNIISANSIGIVLSAISGTQSTITIQGNYIGTTSIGTIKTGVGNVQFGVLVVGNANDSLIGSTASGTGNVIAGNGAGIGVCDVGGALHALNVSILGNSIYGNTGGPFTSLGIDLMGNTNNFSTFTSAGVTANDAGDSDITSNHLMNFPVLSSISSSNGQATITYSLDINDTESGATGYRVEFFANDTADASGNGQGQTYIGADTVSGDVTNRQATITLPSGISGTKFISAVTTMTDNSSDGFGHSSEFSADVVGVLAAASTSPSSSSTTLADTGENVQVLLLIAGALMITGYVGLRKLRG